MSTRVTGLFTISVYIVAGGAAQTTAFNTTASPAVSFPITPGPPHPPIPTANIPALPSDFSDIPSGVISCWDAQANYSSASRFLQTELDNSGIYSFSEWSTISYSYSTYDAYNCSTRYLPSLTTLCDGYPRASAISSTCITTPETYTFTITGTGYYYTPSWSTELEQLPSPTCTIASDFGLVCTRLKDAYNWRQTHIETQTPSPSGSISGPGCSVLNAHTASAKPTCFLEGGSWEAFYWPTPLPTGSAFCATDGTNVTATPTIPGKPNTAVVSGLTLTSPSVYHLLRSATLSTFIGRESLVGAPNSSGTDTFAPSTTAPFLTVAQDSSDILTISRHCAGSNKRRACTFDAEPGFLIADLQTVRVSEYCGKYGCHEAETVVQESYKPSIGLAMSEIVRQNGNMWEECVWTTPGARIRTAGPAAWNGGRMEVESWHGITVKNNARESAETAAPGMRVKMV